METLMPRDTERVVIIGAGHNGLVAACYLAKAGYPTFVLERTDVAGGTAVTEEFHPGFRSSVLFDTTGPFLPQIVKDLQLEKHGLKTIHPDVRLLALGREGQALRIYSDPQQTAAELGRVSANDARKFPEFHSSLQKIGQALAP